MIFSHNRDIKCLKINTTNNEQNRDKSLVWDSELNLAYKYNNVEIRQNRNNPGTLNLEFYNSVSLMNNNYLNELEIIFLKIE